MYITFHTDLKHKEPKCSISPLALADEIKSALAMYKQRYELVLELDKTINFDYNGFCMFIPVVDIYGRNHRIDVQIK